MKRNIILLTVDSLRADHCGFLGGLDLTPTLTNLAEEGIIYENAIAPGPRTPSSMPVAFTGEYIRAIQKESEDYWQYWRENIRQHMNRYRTVAHRLRERGYTTIGFTVNPWTQGTGFNIGFDEFQSINSETLNTYGPLLFKLADRTLRGNELGARVKWYNKREWFIRWTDFYDEIINKLRMADQPYFLWVFLLDTHQPYIAPRTSRKEGSTVGMYYATFRELWSDSGEIPPHVDTRLRKAYRDAIRSVDRFVSRLWDDSQDNNPILVFHSDHGEGFGEHGTYGHERELYRENIHVPVVIHDGSTHNRVSEPISLRMLPYVLDSLGAREKFNPLAFTSDFAISTTEDNRKISVSGTTWNYIQYQGKEKEELYHLSNDPQEESNVATDYPEVTQALRSLAEQHRRHRTEQRSISNAVQHNREDVTTL